MQVIMLENEIEQTNLTPQCHVVHGLCFYDIMASMPMLWKYVE